MELLTAQISRSALLANLAALRQRAGRSAVCAMVKANAYGHGIELVAPVLAGAGAEFLAVARVEEAHCLRRLGLAQPVLLCEPIAAPCGDSYLADRLEAICRTSEIRPTIADAAGAEAAGQMAGRLNVRLPVHLKIDTGMGRGGLPACDAEAVCRLLDRCPSLQLEGVYTHLATADEPDDSFAREQLACFSRIIEKLGSGGRPLPRYIHVANSATLVRFSQPWTTLARPGIALYGYPPDGQTGRSASLSPVLRLTARLVQVKDLPAGHAVGYGCTWRAKRASRIGLVPIGYGDGYSRRFGNVATMQVAGADVPVVGRISMDLTTVDLTDLPQGGMHIRAGTIVTVINEQPEAANSVQNLARLAGTICYEITCRLGTRIRRQLVDNLANPGLVFDADK